MEQLVNYPERFAAFSLGPAIGAELLAELEAGVAAAADEGARDVRIDVRQLGTLEPPVIKTLIRVLRNVRGLGGSVSLAGGRKSVLQTLAVTGLDKLFAVVDSAAA
jgi:anti-anti-sigma regulatory factor